MHVFWALISLLSVQTQLREGSSQQTGGGLNNHLLGVEYAKEGGDNVGRLTV